MKYIDAEKLKEILLPSYEEAKKESLSATDAVKWEKVEYIFDFVFYLIDSIQQDETQVDKMLCSQVWWEEQGWIMIPPDATIEGIDSLLRQVKKKLQQNEKSDKRWQPCDEHFRALKYAIEYFKKKKNDTTHLEDLYNGLKNYNYDKQ